MSGPLSGARVRADTAALVELAEYLESRENVGARPHSEVPAMLRAAAQELEEWRSGRKPAN